MQATWNGKSEQQFAEGSKGHESNIRASELHQTFIGSVRSLIGSKPITLQLAQIWEPHLPPAEKTDRTCVPVVQLIGSCSCIEAIKSQIELHETLQ